MKFASLAFPLICLAAAAEAATGGGGTPAPEAPAKVERKKQNGVTRPSAGTQTGKVWAIADAISTANNRPAKRSEVLEAGQKENINPATITTQYGQWRRFYGITKEATAEPGDAAAKPAKGKKAKAPTEGSTSEQLEQSNERSAEAIAAQAEADARGGVEG